MMKNHEEWNKNLCIKGIVYPKMKILLAFTQHHVVPNLYEFLSSVEQEDILRNLIDLWSIQ